MATSPTIYKLKIALSDLDRNYYDTLALTVARHPSETLERMMSRVVAFCLNASEALVFSKGLSDPDEPDIWAHTLDGTLTLWIDVGEPAVDRIKKASRTATQTKVYSFNRKSDVWWEQNRRSFITLPVSIYQFSWPEVQALAAMAERTMELSATINGNSIYMATAAGECELSCVPLQQQDDPA